MSATPNYSASIEFLRTYHAGRRWTLSAIYPDRSAKRPTITATFDESREAACVAWLEQHGREYNLYFAVNPPSFDVTKKTERTDIDLVVAIHADLDPSKEYELAAERERLLNIIRGMSPKPTCLVDSGRGFWIHYLLSEPLPVNRNLARAERAKEYNTALANKLHADTVANIDRIARLPGTVNHKTGEVASVMEWNRDDSGKPIAYKATDVANPASSAVPDYGDMMGVGLPASNNGGNRAPYTCNAAVERLNSIDDLPRKLRKWVKTMIRVGYNNDALDREIVKGFNEEKAKQGIAPTGSGSVSRNYFFGPNCGMISGALPDRASGWRERN